MSFSDEGMHCGKREKLLLKEIDFLINIRSLTKQENVVPSETLVLARSGRGVTQGYKCRNICTFSDVTLR